MSYEIELTKKEKKLQTDIALLTEELGKINKELELKQALLDQILEIKKKVSPSDKSPTIKTLREGTELAKTRDILKKHAKPLHVDMILEKLGKENNKATKTSLVGSLNRYANANQIFYKEAPNTFTLLEFKEPRKMEEDVIIT